MNSDHHDYGRHFIATIAPRPRGGEALHWSIYPFWKNLQVRLHNDGISVVARDDRAGGSGQRRTA